MGQGNSADVYMPTAVSLGSGFDVELVSVGYFSACAVSTIGELKVCDFGNVRFLVLFLMSPQKKEHVVQFTYCLLALFSDFCQCWGWNFAGQLGYGNTDAIGDHRNEMGVALSTVDLGADFVVAAVHSGAYQRCALSTDGRIKVFYMCIVWSDPL